MSDEDVRAPDGVPHAAPDVVGVGAARDPLLHEVHAHRSPAVDRAVLVDADPATGRAVGIDRMLLGERELDAY